MSNLVFDFEVYSVRKEYMEYIAKVFAEQFCPQIWRRSLQANIFYVIYQI